MKNNFRVIYLIIYIYGSSSFKKDIHSVLEHANIKFRLDEHGEIKDLTTLEQLKDAIEDNPNNIYLIDDGKIIKKNSLNQKLSFLKPKDGIEQEFLLDHGIGDISVDSIDELAKHIIKKLEAFIDEKESNSIEESIIDIVEEAYENDEEKVELDDELSALLSQSSSDDEEDIEESEAKKNENDLYELDSLEENSLSSDFSESFSFDEEFGKLDLSNDDEDEEKYDNIEDIVPKVEESSEDEDTGEFDINAFLSNIDGEEEESKDEEIHDPVIELVDAPIPEEKPSVVEEIKEEEILQKVEVIPQGEKMADDFSEFDTLNEADILAALNGFEGEAVSNEAPQQTSVSPVSNASESSLNLNSANANDISELLTTLLKNKTLEITIKVKD